MSLVFFILLTLSLTMTIGFLYNLSEEVKLFRRDRLHHFQEPVYHQRVQDDVAFFAKWSAVMWSVTICWSVIEIGLKLLAAPQ